MKILVCEPGKHPYVKDIEHTLENLQAEVDGYIQAIYPFEEQVGVIVNEEGLFRDDLAWNRTVEKYGPIKTDDRFLRKKRRKKVRNGGM